MAIVLFGTCWKAAAFEISIVAEINYKQSVLMGPELGRLLPLIVEIGPREEDKRNARARDISERCLLAQAKPCADL